jgi:hypothetical protein
MIGMENMQMDEIDQIDRSQMFFDKKIEEVRNRRAELDFMEKDLLSFKQKLDRRRMELEAMDNKKLAQCVTHENDIKGGRRGL